MSTFESVIWHILGYSAIPVILLIGLFISLMIYYLALKMTGRADMDEHP